MSSALPDDLFERSSSAVGGAELGKLLRIPALLRRGGRREQVSDLKISMAWV